MVCEIWSLVLGSTSMSIQYHTSRGLYSSESSSTRPTISDLYQDARGRKLVANRGDGLCWHLTIPPSSLGLSADASRRRINLPPCRTTHRIINFQSVVEYLTTELQSQLQEILKHLKISWLWWTRRRLSRSNLDWSLLASPRDQSTSDFWMQQQKIHVAYSKSSFRLPYHLCISAYKSLSQCRDYGLRFVQLLHTFMLSGNPTSCRPIHRIAYTSPVNIPGYAAALWPTDMCCAEYIQPELNFVP